MAPKARKQDPGAPSPDELSRIYGAPPEGFTRARDELARELSKAGRTGAAAVVKALRKPTRSAWAIDQLARRFPERIDELLGIGDELVRAQEKALRGGGGEALKEASSRERDRVALLTEAAASILSAHGAVQKDVLARVRTTLRALPTASDEDRKLVQNGSLGRDLEPAPFGRIGESTVKVAAVPARPPPARPPKVSVPGRESAREQKARAAAEAREAARQAASEARDRKQREAERARAVERAGREVRQREAEAELAARGVHAAEKNLADASTRLERARRSAGEATRSLEEARKALEGTKRF